VLRPRQGLGRARIDAAHALRLVQDSGGNVSVAARRASLPRSTMRDLLRRAESSTAADPGVTQAVYGSAYDGEAWMDAAEKLRSYR
jgi:hypothetical protein